MSESSPRKQDRGLAVATICALAIVALAGCDKPISPPLPPSPSGGMPSLPSLPSSSPSLPSPSLPSPSSPSSLPSPSSPSPSGAPSLPSPSSPSPSGAPSLPSPSSGMPSLPSSPSTPTPPDAPSGQSSSTDGDRRSSDSRSNRQQERGDQSQTDPGGAEQQSAGTEQSEQEGSATQTAQSGEPASQDGETQAGEDGWEVSTELPGVADQAGRDAAGDDSEHRGDEEGEGAEEIASDGVLGPHQQTAGAAGAEGTEGTEEKPGGNNELERVLGDLDGDILDKRIAAGDRAEDPTKPAESGQSGQDGDDARSGTDDDSGGAAPGRRTIAQTMPKSPPLPRPETPDLPDARDEDVVARQICEAAMNEKNPQLRAALLEEYERYVAGLRGRRATRAGNCAPR